MRAQRKHGIEPLVHQSPSSRDWVDREKCKQAALDEIGADRGKR